MPPPVSGYPDWVRSAYGIVPLVNFTNGQTLGGSQFKYLTPTGLSNSPFNFVVTPGTSIIVDLLTFTGFGELQMIWGSASLPANEQVIETYDMHSPNLVGLTRPNLAGIVNFALFADPGGLTNINAIIKSGVAPISRPPIVFNNWLMKFNGNLTDNGGGIGIELPPYAGPARLYLNGQNSGAGNPAAGALFVILNTRDFQNVVAGEIGRLPAMNLFAAGADITSVYDIFLPPLINTVTMFWRQGGALVYTVDVSIITPPP